MCDIAEGIVVDYEATPCVRRLELHNLADLKPSRWKEHFTQEPVRSGTNHAERNAPGQPRAFSHLGIHEGAATSGPSEFTTTC